MLAYCVCRNLREIDQLYQRFSLCLVVNLPHLPVPKQPAFTQPLASPTESDRQSRERCSVNGCTLHLLKLVDVKTNTSREITLGFFFLE